MRRTSPVAALEGSFCLGRHLDDDAGIRYGCPVRPALIQAVVVVSWLLVAGCGVAGVAALLRRWSLVVRVARPTALVGAAVLASLFVMSAFFLAVPGAALSALPEVEPDQRARVLAETISSLMNSGATALLAGTVAAVIWILASARNRVIKPCAPG
jgi:hypothetical protein